MALVAPTLPPANGEQNQVTQSSIAEEMPASKTGSEGIDFPYQPNGSPSRPKELDIASAADLKSEEYRQLFRLPPGEVLVQDFNCALQENMLYQGHMYLFRNYVCFYSNIFGFETKKIIPFSEITILRRAKTAGIFPNAIEIFTGERKHFFASFLSRDEAFNLISDLWPDGESNCKENLRQQDCPSESSVHNITSSAIDGTDAPRNSTDDLNSIARIKSQSVPITKGTGNLPVAEDTSTPKNPSTRQENVEVPLEVTNGNSLPLAKGIILKQKDTEAPKVHEDFVKVAEAKFPIKADDFFRLFFSDTTFIEYFRKCCGDTDFTCTPWSPSDEFGHVRELSFLHPIKFYLGAKSGSCRETQKIQSYRNSHLIVHTSQEVNGVPFADYFTVEGLWDVENDESGEACVMKVYINVLFSKKTMWRGKIVQSTLDECREVFSTWINIARELLKKKKLEKQEVTPHSANEDILNHSNKKAESGEVSKQLPETACSSPSFGGKIATIFGAPKNQGYLPHLIVVTVAVLLLMQLTVVLLISRQPHVQPVYQMDYFNHMSQGLHPSPQELAWLEKRLHHLKQEMLMVESRLERMRLEHKHIKSQLEDFEQLRIKID